MYAKCENDLGYANKSKYGERLIYVCLWISLIYLCVSGISGIATTSSTSPEVANEIRARLRGNGNSQTAAVGLVLDELATLMTDVIPRLREMSTALRAGDRVANSEVSWVVIIIIGLGHDLHVAL